MDAGQRFPSQVLTVNPVSPEPEIIVLAARLIRAGRLVAFPTETVYGLGANALDVAAVERIFIAKGRPRTDPLIVHISSPGQISAIAAEVPVEALSLVERFFPGPLTLIFRRSSSVPDAVSAGLDTVAVRMPAHPVALALIEAAGVPIAAPSANLFTHPSPTTAQHVLDDLGGRVDLVLDAGPCPIGLESTVLDMTHMPFRVLRPGGTPVEALREVIPGIVVSQRFLKTDQTAPEVASPGLNLKHYSPRAAVILIMGDGPQPILERISQAAWANHRAGKKVGIMVAEEDLPFLVGIPGQVGILGSASDLEMVGRNLFAVLRQLDGAGVDVILARDFGEEGMGLAIRDRMIRAAEGRVLNANDGNNSCSA